MTAQDLLAPVTVNEDLGGGYFRTSMQAPSIARDARPGQFVMVGSPDPGELLLRRPFSVCLATPAAGTISILYRVVGRGTGMLSRAVPGDMLTVLGPLGIGFTPPRDEQRPVIVAGGIGCAAFPFFVESLAFAGGRPEMLYGGRTHRDLPMLDWFAQRAATTVTTDDGSAGERGLVTLPLRRLLEGAARGGNSPARPRLYTCGPDPMMRAVAALAAEFGVPAEAALETPMACGYGVCVGCVVEVVAGDGAPADDAYGRYKRVCVDGPVFATSAVRW